jgi:creatinine amidohydrolase
MSVQGAGLAGRRFWADWPSGGFAGLDRGALVAVLPVAAIEQHGPHLPLSVDRDILDGIIAAALPLMPDDLPALVLPTCAVGKSNEHACYPGTLTLSAATLMAMWMDIGASVAAAGVHRLVILNSHGGQIAPMDIVARDLRIRHRMIAVAANWFAWGTPPGLLTEDEARHGIHAGDMETSMMLALRPDLVAMDRARDFRPLNARMAAENRHLGLGPGGKLGWQAQDLHPAGAMGNAAAATAAKGRAFVDHAARELVALLAEVAALPLSVLDTAPDPEAAG